MNDKIIVTRSNSHRPDIEKELNDLGVSYDELFVEDYPDVAAKHSIRHSPNVMVDEETVWRGQPSEGD